MHVVSCSVDVAAAVCSGSANAGPARNVRPITLRKAKSMTKSTEKSLVFFGAPGNVQGAKVIMINKIRDLPVPGNPSCRACVVDTKTYQP